LGLGSLTREPAGNHGVADVFFETRTLRYLLDMVGVSQVMVGSDYPFFTRHMLPAKEFEELGLSAAEAEATASGNCLRFLGVF